MTPEQQRIKIAEVLGWTRIRPIDQATCDESLVGCGYEGMSRQRAGCYRPIPDYLNDLNACHEREKILNDKQGGDYDAMLWIIIHRDKTRPACWHASAAQRCEAFLKTLELWE